MDQELDAFQSILPGLSDVFAPTTETFQNATQLTDEELSRYHGPAGVIDTIVVSSLGVRLPNTCNRQLSNSQPTCE